MDSDSREFPIQVEGIDYSRGLSMFAGDREEYLLIMKSFAEEGRELSEKMSRELEAEDFTQYGIHAHTLKGISANIGAEDFSQQAKALEFAAKEGQFTYIYAHHKEVMDAFERMAEGMDRLLKAEFKKDGKEPDGERQKISKEELLQKLRQAYENIDGFYREDARKIIKECRRYELKEYISTGLEKIDRLIEQFQYEEPMQVLSELITELQKQG